MQPPAQPLWSVVFMPPLLGLNVDFLLLFISIKCNIIVHDLLCQSSTRKLSRTRVKLLVFLSNYAANKANSDSDSMVIVNRKTRPNLICHSQNVQNPNVL